MWTLVLSRKNELLNEMRQMPPERLTEFRMIFPQQAAVFAKT
jgi:hypothetical protein